MFCIFWNMCLSVFQGGVGLLGPTGLDGPLGQKAGTDFFSFKYVVYIFYKNMYKKYVYFTFFSSLFVGKSCALSD